MTIGQDTDKVRRSKAFDVPDLRPRRQGLDDNSRYVVINGQLFIQGDLGGQPFQMPVRKEIGSRLHPLDWRDVNRFSSGYIGGGKIIYQTGFESGESKSWFTQDRTSTGAWSGVTSERANSGRYSLGLVTEQSATSTVDISRTFTLPRPAGVIGIEGSFAFSDSLRTSGTGAFLGVSPEIGLNGQQYECPFEYQASTGAERWLIRTGGVDTVVRPEFLYAFDSTLATQWNESWHHFKLYVDFQKLEFHRLLTPAGLDIDLRGIVANKNAIANALNSPYTMRLEFFLIGNNLAAHKAFFDDIIITQETEDALVY